MDFRILFVVTCGIKKGTVLVMAQEQETLMFVCILYKLFENIFCKQFSNFRNTDLVIIHPTSALNSYYGGMVMYCSSGNKVICML